MNWVESSYARIDRDTPPDPGRVTAHRLNRYEYNHTVRDLLGLDLTVSDEFPVDPDGYGFDNIGDVLSLSPVLTEKYLKAAEHIANIAIPPAEPIKPIMSRYLAERMGQARQLHIEVMHEFPVDGMYTLRSAWFEGAQGRGRSSKDGFLSTAKRSRGIRLPYSRKWIAAFKHRRYTSPPDGTRSRPT